MGNSLVEVDKGVRAAGCISAAGNFDMARRKREHEIGDRAIKIVVDAVPDHWVDQEQKKDYGIDLRFEVFRDERTSGHEFGVQVRGSDEVRQISRGAFVTCVVEVEALIDHLEKRRYPVYVFRVDNASRTIYWQFVQQYLSDLGSQKWRTRKTLSITIPVTQTLNDPTRFEELLTEHVAYVNNLHPGSVQAAVAKASKEVQEIDPRLDARITVLNGVVTHTIVPREDVTLNLDLKGEQVNLLKHYLGTGASVTLMDVCVSGSPFFDGKGPAKVELSREVDRTFKCFLVGFSNGKPIRSIELPGVEVSGGTEEMRIQSCVEHPISVKGTHRRNQEPRSDSQTFSISVAKWVGTQILDLPYFEETCNFLSGIKTCDSFQLMTRKLDTIIASRLTPMPDGMGDLIEAIERTKEARDLALRYQVNPKFQLSFDHEDIRILHWLTFDRSPIHVQELIIRDLSSRCGRFKRIQLSTIESPGLIRQTAERVHFDVFGEFVEIGPVTFNYTNCIYEESPELSQHLRLSEDETIIVFKCTPATMLTAELK